MQHNPDRTWDLEASTVEQTQRWQTALQVAIADIKSGRLEPTESSGQRPSEKQQSSGDDGARDDGGDGGHADKGKGSEVEDASKPVGADEPLMVTDVQSQEADGTGSDGGGGGGGEEKR